MQKLFMRVINKEIIINEAITQIKSNLSGYLINKFILSIKLMPFAVIIIISISYK